MAKTSRIKTPIGTIQPYGGGVVPVGALECDGSIVSRTDYAELFQAIGVTWGEGDGSTTFHLPDFRGRGLRGHDNGSGRDPDAAGRTASNTGGATGDNVGTVQDDSIQGHEHASKSWAAYNGNGIYNANNLSYASVAAGTNVQSEEVIDKSGFGTIKTAAESRSKNASVKYVIITGK